MAREHWDNRTAFILAAIGSAIGLGNIWRFPYLMGKYGGVLFLAVYLLIAVAFGMPALMAEWALGRRTRRGTWGAFQRTGMPHRRHRPHSRRLSHATGNGQRIETRQIRRVI